MNNEIGIALERDAYRYWSGILLIHAGTGTLITTELIRSHVADLKNGRPIEHLEGKITESEFDKQNFVRLPIYEAVAIEIIDRLEAYKASGDIRDLGLTF